MTDEGNDELAAECDVLLTCLALRRACAAASRHAGFGRSCCQLSAGLVWAHVALTSSLLQPPACRGRLLLLPALC